MRPSKVPVINILDNAVICEIGERPLWVKSGRSAPVRVARQMQSFGLEVFDA